MTLLLRLLLLICISCQLCHAYHYKTDYANSKWRSRYHATSQKNAWRNSYQPATENPHRIRHSGYGSRFTRLDSVLNRLDHYRATTKKPKSWEDNYFRTSSVESLLGDNNDDAEYTDDDLDDNLNDDRYADEEKLDENEKNDTDYDDEDLDDDTKDKVQAEEATNESPMTVYKWQNYGTRDMVERSREKQMQTSQQTSVENVAQLAVQHFQRVHKAVECSTPMPKVLSVQKEYPNPDRTYLPHCTILHRCSEDTGCCHDPVKQCGPTNQSIVHLYFYVQYQGVSKVEKLAFANHTKCGCLDKDANSLSIDAIDINTIVPPSNLRIGIPPENLRKCKCSSGYTPTHRRSQCICTCAEGSIDCERMEKGKEYFSLKDRLCIKNGQCSPPTCEHGSYMKDLGRCPKKQEK